VQPLRELTAHPRVQDLIKRAINLRADLLDRLDDRLSGVAKKLNLVTRKDLKLVKRQVRELENQVATLENQLRQERARADRAERELGDSLKSTRKATQDAKAAAEAKALAEAKIAELTAASTVAIGAADPGGDEAEVAPAPAKKPRARKKPDTNGGGAAATVEGDEG